MEKVSQQKKAFRLTIAAVGCLLLSILGALVMTVLHDYLSNKISSTIMSDMIVDSPNSPAYEPWVNSSNQYAGLVISTYYVYDIQNVEEILAGGKPLLVEVGPLTYQYNNMKYNTTWEADNDGDIVSYKQYQYYTVYDNATLTTGDIEVTTLNLPLLSLLSNPLVAQIVATTAELAAYKDPSALFVRRKASEVIFGWQNDTLLNTMHEILSFIPTTYGGVQNNDTSLEMALSVHSPNRMYTGKQTPEMLMQLASWDGYDSMQCCAFGPCGDSTSQPSVQAPLSPWNSVEANSIAGTSGSQFKVGITTEDILQVETYDFGIFRHWTLGSDGSTYSVKDIDLIRFALAADSFANITQNYDVGFEYNLFGPSGLLNQSMCSQGAPIYLSKPRFLDADPSLPAALQNFSAPVRELHDTWLGVEPNTGSTFDFHWRIAINAHIQPVTVEPFLSPPYTFLEGITPVFFPVAWGGQDSVISDDQASQFQSQLMINIKIVEGLYWGGMALCAAAGATALGLTLAAIIIRRRAQAAVADGSLGSDFEQETFSSLLSGYKPLKEAAARSNSYSIQRD